MILPIVLLGVGALSCLALKEGKRTTSAPPVEAAVQAESATPAAPAA